MDSQAEAATITSISFVKKIAFYFKAGLFLFLFSLIFAPRVQAATFYFSPTSGSYKIGQTFTVNVYASSPDQAANAFQATVDFPSDKLQVASLSKSGSIMSLWVQEPSFSNGAGTADFAGVVLNPGYTGSSGKILTITFKVVAAGSAKLQFTAASILANDGQGTNILTGFGSATFSLNTAPTGQEAPQSTSPVENAGTLSPPEVTSPTHPDPNKWYNNSDPKFVWQLPQGADGVSIALTQDVNSNPGTQSDGLMTEKTYTNVDDGTWYFHIRLHNRNGWGGIGHFRTRIDTRSPLPFDIHFVNPDQQDNPQPQIYLNAVDPLTGIDHYQLVIGDGVLVDVKPEEISEKNPYTLPVQEPGKHTIVARAYDPAGNTRSALAEFMVTSLVPPTINDYPDSLKDGDILAVRGKTYPDSEVILWLQHDDEEAQNESIMSGHQGAFTYVAPERVKNGIYRMWAEVKDKRGAKSGPSKKITIPVTRSFFMAWGEKTLSILVIVTQFIALIVFIILLFEYTRRKLQKFKEKMRKDIVDTENSIEAALKKMHNNTMYQMTVLEKAKKKRSLTKEEDVIFKQMQEQTEAVEKLVKEKMDSLEEEVK